MPALLSVNVVHAVIAVPGVPRTAIDKRAQDGRLAVGALGVAGDEQCDKPGHGGVDQAVYAYADEDRGWWAAELGRDIAPGAFGENLTTRGVDVTNAVIGEIWRVGSATLQVTTPRIPCKTFAGFWQVKDLVRRFTEHGAPGAYLRVVDPGDVGAGDPVEVADRPSHGLTIHDIFAARAGARDRVRLIAEAPEVVDQDRDWALRILGAADRPVG